MRLKIKYAILLTQLLLVLLLPLKIKQLALIISSKKKKKKKNGYNTEVNKIGKKIANHNHDNYITIPEFYKFSKEIFGLRLSRANFASQGYIFNFVNMTDFDNQVKTCHSNYFQ